MSVFRGFLDSLPALIPGLKTKRFFPDKNTVNYTFMGFYEFVDIGREPVIIFLSPTHMHS